MHYSLWAGRKTRVHHLAGKTPAIFIYGGNMKELSIFIDESGDFGEYDYHSPYYIISMVFHDQSIDLSDNLKLLEQTFSNLNILNHCVHAGPIIRNEEEYRNMQPETRVKLLKALMAFMRSIDVNCKSFYIEKKHIENSVEAAGKLSKEISGFIKEHYEYFLKFDTVKVYYDNGQIEVNKILSAVFNVLLENVEFRKVLPADYRLFQIADLVCTLKLAELKLENHLLSKSEINFFLDERTLRKNYLKPLQTKYL